jgi:hypothetical protein
MLIPDSKEKKVFFYPLIRLKQSVIDSVPAELRIKQFFNKGLFESLLRYHGSAPIQESTAKLSLEKARKYGYFNNNIKVTLDTLFKYGTVIYVDKNTKNPYVIADNQNTIGDWKIDAKPSDVFDLYPNVTSVYQANMDNYQDSGVQKRKQEIEKLEKEAIELQTMHFGNNGDYFQKRQELIKPIQDRVFTAMKKLAKKDGYAFVFDKANQSNLIYADKEYDISDDVLEEMGISK